MPEATGETDKEMRENPDVMELKLKFFSIVIFQLFFDWFILWQTADSHSLLYAAPGTDR